MWSDTVKYYFSCAEIQNGTPVLVPEPKNYKDGNGSKYERDNKSRGIMRVKSNSLEFFAEAYDYLLKVNSLFGVIPDVRVRKYIKDPFRLDQRWTLVSDNGIDLTEMDFDNTNKTVKAKYTNGGLVDKLEARIDDEYDLIETTSVTGADIGELKTDDVSLHGRDIFLQSELETSEGVKIEAEVSGGDRDDSKAVPFLIKTNSDGNQLNNDSENINSIVDVNLSFGNGNFGNGKAGGTTYLISDRDRELRIKGNINFEIYIRPRGSISIGLLLYENGSNLDFLSFNNFATIDTRTVGLISIPFDFDLRVLEGQSWTIGYNVDFDSSGSTIGIEYKEGTFLTITEDSIAPASISRALTYFEAIDRTMARAFGESGLFKSDLLGVGGEMESLLVANGLFIRQFPNVLNEGTDEERRIQFIVSLKSLFEGLEMILPIAYWVEKYGNKEVLRLEKASYTLQNFVGVHYGNKRDNGTYDYIPVQKLTRKVIGSLYYSSAEIGSQTTGSNYDNFFGLTAFNGKAVYNFINDTKGVPYTATTDFRTGDIDVEITRRFSFDKYKDRDTSMDEDIFILDCKKTGNGYALRRWQDDFEVAPLNLYRPDSAFNLRFNPAQLLLNHSYIINAGLQHYPQQFARWASSNCNSSLITKKVAEVALENGQPIAHTRFEKAKIRPMEVSFDMPVSLEIERQINGKQPNGVPNWYGLTAILVDGNIETVRIANVDTNKEGKHKTVESA